MSSGKEKQQKKHQLTSSVLYNTFVGNIITVFVKNIRGSAKYKTSNLMMSGYLLDECDHFIYLGETPDEVTIAIPKNDLGPIMMGDPSSLEELPEGMELQ